VKPAQQPPHHGRGPAGQPHAEGEDQPGDQQVGGEVADDVAKLGDGGGFAQAPPRPLVGAGKVARFLMGTLVRATGAVTVDFVACKEDRQI